MESLNWEFYHNWCPVLACCRKHYMGEAEIGSRETYRVELEFRSCYLPTRWPWEVFLLASLSFYGRHVSHHVMREKNGKMGVNHCTRLAQGSYWCMNTVLHLTVLVVATVTVFCCKRHYCFGHTKTLVCQIWWTFDIVMILLLQICGL